MSISNDNADLYYDRDNHMQSAVWQKFDPDQRAAALAQSKRELTQLIGCDIDDEVEDISGNHYPDRAAYEQSLHILLKSSAIHNGEETAPAWIAGMAIDDAPYGQGALQWLNNISRQASTIRG